MARSDERLAGRLAEEALVRARLEAAVEDLQQRLVGMMAVLTREQKQKLGLVEVEHGGGGEDRSGGGDSRRTSAH